ncbi:metal-dependent hydrolase (plasmid) [Haloferax sp. S1W]|uniref:metal-dependent hydrolase n=1 Tax=Haloferax sp. S1W TaxID=3377110 RepID=UPI0037C71E84
MWPWEHLAVGYILFSLLVRVFDWTLDDVSAVALAFGTQFPDLIDKPLAWTFAVLPSGTSLAHSVFIAVPVSLAVMIVLSRWSRLTVGVGFAVGYLAHPPSDILYGQLTEGGPLSFDSILWPFVEQSGSVSGGGLFGRVAIYIGEYQEFIAISGSTSPQVVGYLVFEAVLLATAIALWLTDGRPGVELARRAVGRSV